MVATGQGTAVGIAGAVLDGSADAGDAARAARCRIDAENGWINAVVGYDPGAADAQIEALRRRLEAGERPPLAGVPVLVKDHIRVAGWPATQGSLLFRDFVAEADDLAVRRLRHAGAILIGRSNMSEFGSKGVTTNVIYGPTRHPRDPDLTTGGSSGGAAAALAANFVPLALASDGGGSGRRPAAHAGVVGFKPSAGAIAEPRALSQTAVLCPMARTVADVALAFDALRGADPADPFSVDLPVRPYSTAPRIVYSRTFGLDVPIDTDVETAMEEGIERLSRAGFAIERRDPLWPEGAGEAALMPIQYAGLALTHGAEWRRAPERFDPDIGIQIEAGVSLPAEKLARAYALSTAVAGAVARFFADGVDFLVGPTTPCVAWPHALLGPATIGGVAVHHRGHAVFTPLFNHALCPAISIPCGTGRDGLPVGMQLIAPRFADIALLTIAQQIESTLSAAVL